MATRTAEPTARPPAPTATPCGLVVADVDAVLDRLARLDPEDRTALLWAPDETVARPK